MRPRDEPAHIASINDIGAVVRRRFVRGLLNGIRYDGHHDIRLAIHEKRHSSLLRRQRFGWFRHFPKCSKTSMRSSRIVRHSRDPFVELCTAAGLNQ